MANMVQKLSFRPLSDEAPFFPHASGMERIRLIELLLNTTKQINDDAAPSEKSRSGTLPAEDKEKEKEECPSKNFDIDRTIAQINQLIAELEAQESAENGNKGTED